MIRIQNWWLLSLLLLGLQRPTALAQEEPPEPVSLKEAIDLTLASHPLMQAAREDLAIFQAKLMGANLTWLPKVKGSGLLSVTPAKTGNAVEGGTHYDDWGPYYSIELSGALPLYTFGKIRHLKAMARAGIGVGNAQMEIARSHLEALVVEAFEGLRYTLMLVDLLDDGQQYMKRARDYLEKLRDEDNEDYDDVDMLKLRVYESEVEGRRLEAVQARDTARLALELLTGLSADRFSPGPLVAFPVELKSQTDYEDLARASRGELRALNAAVRAQDRRVSLELSQMFPTFYLGGYFKYSRATAVEQQPSPFAYDPYNSWFAGVGLAFEWTFDAASRFSAMDEQKAQKRKYAAQMKGMEQRIRLDVRRAHSDVLRLKEKINLDNKAFKAARGWMLAKLDLYEGGFCEFRDVKESLAEYFLRKMAVYESTYQFNLAVSRLAVACGVPLSNLIPVE